MNEDINREILNELKKANRTNQIGIGLAILALLILGVYFVALRPNLYFDRQRTAAAQVTQPRPWKEVDDAVDQFDYPRAIKLVQGIIERQPGNYYGYAYLGHIYLTMGNVTNAESQYAKACELLPSEDNEKMLRAIRKRLAEERAAESASKP